ncbi:hypothetical protein [Labrys neptuniae]
MIYTKLMGLILKFVVPVIVALGMTSCASEASRQVTLSAEAQKLYERTTPQMKAWRACVLRQAAALRSTATAVDVVATASLAGCKAEEADYKMAGDFSEHSVSTMRASLWSLVVNYVSRWRAGER